jgi:hypothetical protein
MTRILKTRWLFFALSILFAAAGAAQAQFLALPAATKGDYGAIHSVAVISAIGDKATLSFGNFWGNSSKELPIQDWNIDALVETRLRQYLSGRFSFKDILYDRAALAKIPNTPFSFSSSQFQDFLKSLPPAQVDAYIIVRPDLEYKSPGVAGLGLTNADNLGQAMTPNVWANYEIDIVDAHSLKTIAYAGSRLRLRDNALAGFAGAPVTALRVDGDFELTDAQAKILHGSIVTLVNLSLVETLRALDTGVELPSSSARTLVPIPPDRDPYKAYKNVAVVSALGDTITLNHRGVGALLSMDTVSLPEPDWHLDALVEARARLALAKRFQIVEPNVDRQAFAHVAPWDDKSGRFSPDFPGLKPDPAIDLYVVFVNVNSFIMIGQKAKGVGVFNLYPILNVNPETTSVFAHYGVIAIDAKTMKYIAAVVATASPDNASADPRQTIDNADWPEPPAQITAAQNAAIQDKVVAVLDNSIDESLLELALLGVVPTRSPPPASASAQN